MVNSLNTMICTLKVFSKSTERSPSSSIRVMIMPMCFNCTSPKWMRKWHAHNKQFSKLSPCLAGTYRWSGSCQISYWRTVNRSHCTTVWSRNSTLITPWIRRTIQMRTWISLLIWCPSLTRRPTWRIIYRVGIFSATNITGTNVLILWIRGFAAAAEKSLANHTDFTNKAKTNFWKNLTC